MDVAQRYQVSNRTAPDAISTEALPHLIALGSHLLAVTPPPAAPEATGRLLHFILKIYRMSIQHGLTAQHQQSIVAWGTLLLQVVNRLINPADVPVDLEDREKCQWWKAKKWAYESVSDAPRSYRSLLIRCAAVATLRTIRLAESASLEYEG